MTATSWPLAELPELFVVAAAGVALVRADLGRRRLPVPVIALTCAAATVLLAISAVRGDWAAVQRGLGGAAALLGLVGALRLDRPRVIGYRETALAGAFGACLGAVAWVTVAFGAVTTLVLLGRAGSAAHRSGGLRAASCIVAAATASLVLATPVTGWYGALLPA